MPEPREFTSEEVRDLLLKHIVGLCHYWAHETRVTSIEDRLQGLAFSILSALDGSSAELPTFEVVCTPHPTDKEFHLGQGENWFPRPMASDDGKLDIDAASLGNLHEFWHEAVKRAGRVLPTDPALLVDADAAWKAKTPDERLADLVGSAEAARLRTKR